METCLVQAVREMLCKNGLIKPVETAFDTNKQVRMTRAGIIPEQWKRFVLVYELWTELVAKGMNKMDAYGQAGARYFTSEANARRIVARMQSPV